jgi:hypothetical protein
MGIHRLAENVTVDFDAHDIPGFARQLGASLSMSLQRQLVVALALTLIPRTHAHTRETAELHHSAADRANARSSHHQPGTLGF